MTSVPALIKLMNLRRGTAGDLPEIALADGRAFGTHHSESDLDDFRPLFDPDRFLLARDPADDTVIGVTGAFGFDVTLPGGASLPAPGLTWVSVAVTHRRRGVLRALLHEQHRGFVDDGYAVSLLTASEGGIYGRFGYGIATQHRAVSITRHRARIREGVPDPGGVRAAGTDEARPHLAEVHRRWVAATPAAVTRSGAWWDAMLRDREYRRGGASALFHLLHPDGYVSYRMLAAEQTCRVVDMVSLTPDAHAALWRVLLASDLVETITMRSFPLDDPLPWLLTDPRQVRTTDLADGMWARILDVPAVLSARRYGVEIDVVLDVHDPFLDLGGRFRLCGGPEGATCEPVGRGAGGAPADGAAIDVAALGALAFGGHRAPTQARAGLLQAGPATLRRLDRAFLADRAPQHGTEF